MKRQNREWTVSSAIDVVRPTTLEDSTVALLEGETFALANQSLIPIFTLFARQFSEI